MLIFLTCVHCTGSTVGSSLELERRPSLEGWDPDLREDISRLSPGTRARMNAQLAQFRASLASRNGELRPTSPTLQDEHVKPEALEPGKDFSRSTSRRTASLRSSVGRDIDTQLQTLQGSSRAPSTASSIRLQSGGGPGRTPLRQNFVGWMQRFRPQGPLFATSVSSKGSGKSISSVDAEMRKTTRGHSPRRPQSPQSERTPLLGASSQRRMRSDADLSLFHRKPRSADTQRSSNRLKGGEKPEVHSPRSSAPHAESNILKRINDAISRFRDLDRLHSTADVFAHASGSVMLEQARRGWHRYYPDIDFEPTGRSRNQRALVAKTMVFQARGAHDKYARYLGALRQQVAALPHPGSGADFAYQHELRQALLESEVVGPAMDKAIWYLEQAIRRGDERHIEDAMRSWDQDISRITKRH